MKRLAIVLLLAAAFLSGCQEETAETIYLYEVNPVDIREEGADKNSLKTDLEFISLAYSDLYGSTPTDQELINLVTAYNTMGDKELVADIVIRNLLNNERADVPTAQAMRADVSTFISETYKRFYVREPSEYERWFMEDLITNDPNVTPEIIYYAFLTSNEYRFF
ncbi:MAG: hypothetical protein AAGI38_00305 [Bacteroidota bacterium]